MEKTELGTKGVKVERKRGSNVLEVSYGKKSLIIPVDWVSRDPEWRYSEADGVSIKDAIDRVDVMMMYVQEAISNTKMPLQTLPSTKSLYEADRKYDLIGQIVRDGCTFQNMYLNVKKDHPMYKDLLARQKEFADHVCGKIKGKLVVTAPTTLKDVYLELFDQEMANFVNAANIDGKNGEGASYFGIGLWSLGKEARKTLPR